MKENEDYELIPSDKLEENWHVRILTGKYPETIIRFGSINFDGVNDQLKYNFSIIYSPDDMLSTEDKNFQVVAGSILESIIERGLKDGSIGVKDTK